MQAVVADESRIEDRVLRQVHFVVGDELGMDVIDVGDVRATQFVDQGEQGVAIEVHPDQRARNAALVAREAAYVGRAEGVDPGLLAGHRIRQALIDGNSLVQVGV